MPSSVRGAALACILSLIAALPMAATPSPAALFEERVASVVVVEAYLQLEVERRPLSAVGLVADEAGLVVVHESAIPSWLPPDQLRDFRVRTPGVDGDGVSASYLGQDNLSGWHYLRIDEEAETTAFVPITRWESAHPQTGERLWGIGLQLKDFDYQPYYLEAAHSTVFRLPLEVGLATTYVAAPGSAVFDAQGRFVGWAGTPLTEERLLAIGGEQLQVGFVNRQESPTYLLAEPFLADLGRVPESPAGGPLPWLGVAGMQPIDREVADLLGLEEQGAIVLSKIIEESPAAEAGLQDRDIVVEAAGEPLPKLRPDGVVTGYLDRLLQQRNPGDSFDMVVLRGQERIPVTVTVGDHPKPLKRARKEYFGEIGLSVREFVVHDAISRQVDRADWGGVIASFVKENSPAAAAGLSSGDWIQQIDGEAVAGYEEALEGLRAALANGLRQEVVFLVRRGNETEVLRVQLER